MDSVQKGDATEAIVLSKLVKKGYTVLHPWDDNQRYDLVLDIDGDFLRVQVKTGNYKEEYVEVHVTSNRSHSSGVEHKPYDKTQIDGFLVYCYEKNEMYWIPIEESNTSRIWLRYEAKQDQPQINWAEDYLFEENFEH